MLSASDWEGILAAPSRDRLVSEAVALAANQLRPATDRGDLRLRDFIREGWHVAEPAEPFIPNWHLDAIAEHLEAVSRGEIRDLVINIPPGFAKSLLTAVFWPAWEWTWAPWHRWIFATYAQPLSIRDSLRCRRLIESDWYQERWGTLYQLAADQNTKTKFENTRTGYRFATSVGGVATGERGHRVVVDDPHNVKKAVSDVEREAGVEWYFQTMSTRAVNPATFARVVIMQRLHERDLSGQILERGGYEHLCLPMRFEPQRRCVTGIGWQDPRTTDGELLFPSRVPASAVAVLETDLGSYGAAGQLQQSPAPAKGGIIQKAWFRRYDTEPVVWDEEWISWDMTFKGGRADLDFVAGEVWGRLGADCYLRDLVCAQLEFPETLKGTEAVCVAWPLIRGVLVEDKANGPAVISSLRHKLPGLVPYEPPGALEGRVRAIAPVIEAGNVYVPGPRLERERFEYWRRVASVPGSWLPLEAVHENWVDRFVHQWGVFPRGANDDQVAAGVQALERMMAGVASQLAQREATEQQRAHPESEASATSRMQF